MPRRASARAGGSRPREAVARTPSPNMAAPPRTRPAIAGAKGRRGFFGTIFYWGLTLALWGAIALAGIIG